MRHRVDGRKLGRPTGHRVAMYRNLVTDLLQYETIVTTEAKAKEIRGMAEKTITLGKNGSLHARRQALAFVFDKKVVAKLFGEIASRYENRGILCLTLFFLYQVNMTSHHLLQKALVQASHPQH